MHKAFSLIEALIYIAVLVIIRTALVSFLIWTLNSNTKIKARHEAMSNGERALRILVAEIRTSQDMYLPSSILDNDTGQLSLVTTKDRPTDENITYKDFYLSNGIIYLKKESLDPVALTNDQVFVDQLKFSPVDESSLEINLRLNYRLVSKPQWQNPISWQVIASPRQAY